MKIPVDYHDHNTAELSEASEAKVITTCSTGGVEVASDVAETVSDAISAVLMHLRWSGWSTKIPVDYHDHHSADLSEASEAGGITTTSTGGVEVAADEEETGSDAIRAVLMHHLRARRQQVRIALKEAVQTGTASQILRVCHEAKGVGVAQTEIDEALEVVAKIFATASYEIVMQGGSAADIIHCLGCKSHLSSEETAQLEMRLGAEAFALIQRRDWRCARDLLCAAETAGVSFLQDANGEKTGLKTIRLMVEEAYDDEAMEEAGSDALSEASASLEGDTRHKEGKNRPTLSLALLQKEDTVESLRSISTVASESLLVFENDTAAAG
jgi:hypothetical protein